MGGLRLPRLAGGKPRDPPGVGLGVGALPSWCPAPGGFWCPCCSMPLCCHFAFSSYCRLRCGCEAVGYVPLPGRITENSCIFPRAGFFPGSGLNSALAGACWSWSAPIRCISASWESMMLHREKWGPAWSQTGACWPPWEGSAAPGSDPQELAPPAAGQAGEEAWVGLVWACSGLSLPLSLPSQGPEGSRGAACAICSCFAVRTSWRDPSRATTPEPLPPALSPGKPGLCLSVPADGLAVSDCVMLSACSAAEPVCGWVGLQKVVVVCKNVWLGKPSEGLKVR